MVFDLDGTLVDAFEDITAAANHIRELNSLPPLAISEVKKYVGHGARVLVQRVLGIDDDMEIERNHDSLVAFYTNHPSGTSCLYPGTTDVLSHLRTCGIKTAVCSNKPDQVTQRVLEDLGVRSLLDGAMGETEGVRRKPAADMMHVLMQKLDVTAAETLMVGDTEVDISFARAAGVRCVGVTYGQYDRKYLAGYGPDVIIDSLSELPGLVVSE